MSRFLKSFFAIALIPWALVAVGILMSPVINYIDRTRPLQFHPPADFRIVLSRNLVPGTVFYYEGDYRLIRIITKRSPKAVITLLEKDRDSPNEVVRIAKSNAEMINRNEAVDSVSWPSIPHGPTGDCYYMSYGGMTYSKFFIWPDGKGGTVMEILEGFRD